MPYIISINTSILVSRGDEICTLMGYYAVSSGKFLLLRNTEEQLICCQEHFSKILNHPLDDQVDEEEMEEGEYEANPRISTKVPAVIEIKKALKELRNGKAAGADNISPEVMKVDLDTTANMFHPLFEKMWMRGEMPNDWRLLD